MAINCDIKNAKDKNLLMNIAMTATNNNKDISAIITELYRDYDPEIMYIL